MPTDTTIIDRLRKRAREEPSNGQGGGKLLLDAADALTAAHAARDAAERERDELQERSYQMIAGIEADAATLLATKRDCSARVEQATHAARHAIEGAAEKMNTLRAQRAAVIAEKDMLRAQLTTALRERDEARAALAEMTERERQAHAKRRP